MRKKTEIGLTFLSLMCSVVCGQTTIPIEAVDDVNESTASVVSMLQSAPMPVVSDSTMRLGKPMKIMKVIDTPETIITAIMVSVPEGHEDRMHKLREAYTTAGLSSADVAKLLQIDAKMILAREAGNTASVAPLAEERNKILSMSQRQKVRDYLIGDALKRKAEKRPETTTGSLTQE